MGRKCLTGTFRGDTVEGLSQVLAEHLGFPSDKGEPEGFPVLVAWAAAKLGNRLSEEYKNVLSGTQLLVTKTAQSLKQREPGQNRCASEQPRNTSWRSQTSSWRFFNSKT